MGDHGVKNVENTVDTSVDNWSMMLVENGEQTGA